MKDRIVSNWKSTIVGVLLIIAALVLVFFDKVTWTEFAAFAPFCIGLILVKDDSFKKKKTPILLIFVLFSVLFLQGCVSYEKCVEKYGVVRHDTLFLTQDVPITIPVTADSMQTFINIDSLRSIIVGQLYKTKDSVSELQILYWKDKYNNIHIKAYKPPDTLKLKVPVTIPCPPVVELKKTLAWYEVAWERYKSFSAFALILCVAILILILRKR